MNRPIHLKTVAAVVAALLMQACRVGPNYSRPSAPAPPAFKEAPPPNFKEAEAAGWKQAQPGDAYNKGMWWEIYQDPALNALEEQVKVSNQNVVQAEAVYREAKAQIQIARSALFPTVSVGPSITASRNGTTATAIPSGVHANYSLPFDVSWEPDLWGSVRRGITAASATSQASAADVENARLLYQAQLAEDYFQLHGNDAAQDLLNRTVTAYEQYLKLTRDRLSGGVASDLDVATAESQLYGAQAGLIDLGVQRAQLEHAIAILIGKPPSELTIPPTPLATTPPPVPIGLPSELLQRRPDIAGSERRVAAANEQIGIAMAAFYPSLTLSASAGLESSSLGKWFTWPSRFWSVGPGLAETLFDAGKRKATVVEERAAYDATVAAYRQTVLTAMQQVEDYLAALRILEQETAKEEENVKASERALGLATDQYKAGTVAYLNVITAQATLFTAQRSLVTLLSQRMTASVQLVEALGGGWNASSLPH